MSTGNKPAQVNSHLSELIEESYRIFQHIGINSATDLLSFIKAHSTASTSIVQRLENTPTNSWNLEIFESFLTVPEPLSAQELENLLELLINSQQKEFLKARQADMISSEGDLLKQGISGPEKSPDKPRQRPSPLDLSPQPKINSKQSDIQQINIDNQGKNASDEILALKTEVAKLTNTNKELQAFKEKAEKKLGEVPEGSEKQSTEVIAMKQKYKKMQSNLELLDKVYGSIFDDDSEGNNEGERSDEDKISRLQTEIETLRVENLRNNDYISRFDEEFKDFLMDHELKSADFVDKIERIREVINEYYAFIREIDNERVRMERAKNENEAMKTERELLRKQMKDMKKVVDDTLKAREDLVKTNKDKASQIVLLNTKIAEREQEICELKQIIVTYRLKVDINTKLQEDSGKDFTKLSLNDMEDSPSSQQSGNDETKKELAAVDTNRLLEEVKELRSSNKELRILSAGFRARYLETLKLMRPLSKVLRDRRNSPCLQKAKLEELKAYIRELRQQEVDSPKYLRAPKRTAEFESIVPAKIAELSKVAKIISAKVSLREKEKIKVEGEEKASKTLKQEEMKKTAYSRKNLLGKQALAEQILEEDEDRFLSKNSLATGEISPRFLTLIQRMAWFGIFTLRSRVQSMRERSLNLAKEIFEFFEMSRTSDSRFAESKQRQIRVSPANTPVTKKEIPVLNSSIKDGSEDPQPRISSIGPKQQQITVPRLKLPQRKEDGNPISVSTHTITPVSSDNKAIKNKTEHHHHHSEDQEITPELYQNLLVLISEAIKVAIQDREKLERVLNSVAGSSSLIESNLWQLADKKLKSLETPFTLVLHNLKYTEQIFTEVISGRAGILTSLQSLQSILENREANTSHRRLNGGGFSEAQKSIGLGQSRGAKRTAELSSMHGEKESQMLSNNEAHTDVPYEKAQSSNWNLKPPKHQKNYSLIDPNTKFKALQKTISTKYAPQNEKKMHGYFNPYESEEQQSDYFHRRVISGPLVSADFTEIQASLDSDRYRGGNTERSIKEGFYFDNPLNDESHLKKYEKLRQNKADTSRKQAYDTSTSMRKSMNQQQLQLYTLRTGEGVRNPGHQQSRTRFYESSYPGEENDHLVSMRINGPPNTFINHMSGEMYQFDKGRSKYLNQYESKLKFIKRLKNEEEDSESLERMRLVSDFPPQENEQGLYHRAKMPPNMSGIHEISRDAAYPVQKKTSRALLSRLRSLNNYATSVKDSLKCKKESEMADDTRNQLLNVRAKNLYPRNVYAPSYTDR